MPDQHDPEVAEDVAYTDHQALMDAHRAVTRNYPTGAEPEAHAGRPLAERIDALARICQRVGHDAGWAAGRASREEAVGGLKAAYAAVALAFPGGRAVAPEGPLAEHIEALADACYRQGYDVGKAWQAGWSAVVEARAEAIAACVAALRDRARRYAGHAEGHDLHRAAHIESDAAYLERTVKP